MSFRQAETASVSAAKAGFSAASRKRCSVQTGRPVDAEG